MWVNTENWETGMSTVPNCLIFICDCILQLSSLQFPMCVWWSNWSLTYKTGHSAVDYTINLNLWIKPDLPPPIHLIHSHFQSTSISTSYTLCASRRCLFVKTLRLHRTQGSTFCNIMVHAIHRICGPTEIPLQAKVWVHDIQYQHLVIRNFEMGAKIWHRKTLLKFWGDWMTY